MTSTEFAKKIGVSVSTVKRWSNRGTLIPALRTPTGRRQYSENQVKNYFRKDDNENESKRD